MVEYLLSAGADLSATDQEGLDALAWATRRNRTAIATILREAAAASEEEEIAQLHADVSAGERHRCVKKNPTT